MIRWYYTPLMRAIEQRKQELAQRVEEGTPAPETPLPEEKPEPIITARYIDLDD